MLGSVLSFRAEPAPRQGWSNQDLADLYRVKDILNQAGLSVFTDSGLTDEGDPWFVFVRSDTEDVVAHFARDGAMVVATGGVSGQLYRGRKLRDIINQLLSEQPLLLPYNPRSSGNVRLHPLVVLSAFVAMAFMTQQKETHAAVSEDAEDNDDDDGAAKTTAGQDKDPTADLWKAFGASEIHGLSISQSATLAAVISIAISMSSSESGSDPLELAESGALGEGEGSGALATPTLLAQEPADPAATPTTTDLGLSGTNDQERDFTADDGLGLWTGGVDPKQAAALSVAASIMSFLPGGKTVDTAAADSDITWALEGDFASPTMRDVFEDIFSAQAPATFAALEELLDMVLHPTDGLVGQVQGDIILTAAPVLQDTAAAESAPPETPKDGAAVPADGDDTTADAPAEPSEDTDAATTQTAYWDMQAVSFISLSETDDNSVDTVVLDSDEDLVSSDFLFDILYPSEGSSIGGGADDPPSAWSPTSGGHGASNGGTHTPIAGHLVNDNTETPLDLSLADDTVDIVLFEQGSVDIHGFNPETDSLWIMGDPEDYAFSIITDGEVLTFVSQQGWRITFFDMAPVPPATAKTEGEQGHTPAGSGQTLSADSGTEDTAEASGEDTVELVDARPVTPSPLDDAEAGGMGPASVVSPLPDDDGPVTVVEDETTTADGTTVVTVALTGDTLPADGAGTDGMADSAAVTFLAEGLIPFTFFSA